MAWEADHVFVIGESVLDDTKHLVDHGTLADRLDARAHEREQTAQAELDEIRLAIDDLLATMPLARAILWCMAVIDKAVSWWTRRRG